MHSWLGVKSVKVDSVKLEIKNYNFTSLISLYVGISGESLRLYISGYLKLHIHHLNT